MRSSKIFWHMTAHSQGRKDVLHVAISLRPIAAIKVHILSYFVIWFGNYCVGDVTPKGWLFFIALDLEFTSRKSRKIDPWNHQPSSAMTPRVSDEKPSVIWSNFIFHLFVFGELPHRSKYIYIYMHMHVYLSMGVPGDASNNKWVPCKLISMGVPVNI